MVQVEERVVPVPFRVDLIMNVPLILELEFVPEHMMVQAAAVPVPVVAQVVVSIYKDLVRLLLQEHYLQMEEAEEQAELLVMAMHSKDTVVLAVAVAE